MTELQHEYATTLRLPIHAYHNGESGLSLIHPWNFFKCNIAECCEIRLLNMPILLGVLLDCWFQALFVFKCGRDCLLLESQCFYCWRPDRLVDVVCGTRLQAVLCHTFLYAYVYTFSFRQEKKD